MKHLILILFFSQFIFPQTQWYKGNLHTHSLWSDGDDFPEMIITWYKNQGYDFIALSDHNIIAQGEKWVETEKVAEAFQRYLEFYGDDWVDQKTDSTLWESSVSPNGSLRESPLDIPSGKVRLKTFDEYKSLLEEPEKFLIIKSEEISDKFEKKPIHINAANIQVLIEPQHGNSVYEVMQNNIDAINEQREKTGTSIMPHLNHPNFRWAVTAEDIIKLRGDKFFEIYNGHPLVNNFGDSIHAGTEEMWDIILTERLTAGKEIMYGIAVDDAHNYFSYDTKQSNPGRGWVVVKADSLTPESIIYSMEDGNFYSSSGVEVEDIEFNNNVLSIKIKPADGINYTTQFIGTKNNYTKTYEDRFDATGEKVTRKYSDEIGIILKEVKGDNPVYNLSGDEIYVRAKIISSKIKENPYQPGEFESAWVQPVLPGE